MQKFYPDTIETMSFRMTETTSYYLLLGISILPVIVLLVFIYSKDKCEKEPLPMLVKGLLFGALSTIPAIFLEQIVSTLNVFKGTMPIASGLFEGFCVAGICEELSKLTLLWLCVWNNRHFNEYFDGIVYSACISLGFACVENIGYVFSPGDFAAQLHTGITRAFLSVPGHFLFGVVMGFYFALAKFEGNTLKNLWMAFLIPMLLHGTFDALLMIPDNMGDGAEVFSLIFFVVFLWFDFRLWKMGSRRLSTLQEKSRNQNNSNQYRDKDYQDENVCRHSNPFETRDKKQYRQHRDVADDKKDAFKGIDWDV